MATELWAMASGYKHFKNLASQGNMTNQFVNEACDNTENWFKKILWTRDIISMASLGLAAWTFIEVSFVNAMAVYILSLFFFAMLLQVFLGCYAS